MRAQLFGSSRQILDVILGYGHRSKYPLLPYFSHEESSRIYELLIRCLLQGCFCTFEKTQGQNIGGILALNL